MMYKRIIVFLTVFFFFVIGINAQRKLHISIAGYSSMLSDTDSILCKLYKYSPYFENDEDRIILATVKDHQFDLFIDSVKDVQYIDILPFKVRDRSIRPLVRYLIEGNSSLRIVFDTETVYFKGEMASIFDIQYKMKEISQFYNARIHSVRGDLFRDVKHYLEVGDTIARDQLELLKMGSKGIPTKIQEILREDVLVGREIAKLIQLRLFYNTPEFSASFSRYAGDSDENYQRKEFLSSHLHNLYQSGFGNSSFYSDYIVYKLKFDSSVYGNQSLNLVNCYREINEHYSGRIRDEAILKFLYMNRASENFAIDKLAQTKITRMALNDVRDSAIYRSIKKISHSYLVGEPAFNFSLLSEDGKVVRLTDFRGKAIFVDFWFTGCGNCVRVTPFLESIEKEYAKGNIIYLSVCIDNDTALWKKSLISGLYATTKSIKLFNLEADGRFGFVSYYHITGCPSYLLIDEKGNLFSTPVDPRYDNGKALRADLSSVSR